MDSQLIIQQMKGNYKVKNKNMKPLFLEVKELEKKIKYIDYHHILREQE